MPTCDTDMANVAALPSMVLAATKVVTRPRVVRAGATDEATARALRRSRPADHENRNARAPRLLRVGNVTPHGTATMQTGTENGAFLIHCPLQQQLAGVGAYA